MQIESYLQSPQVQSRIDQVKKAKDDATQMAAIMALFRQIQMASKSIVDEIEEGVSISNLDEVTTALHNETAKNTKLLLSALKDIKLSSDKQAIILAEITKSSQARVGDEFQTITIRKPRDKVFVANFNDMPLAEDVKVNNLSEVVSALKHLEDVFQKSLKIDLPAPQVVVNPPQVTVQAPDREINIPEFDTSPIVATLMRYLKKIKDNNASNPMFTRMADLDRLLGKLDEVSEASRNVMLGFPGLIGIRGFNGGIADPATFGSANSGVANTLTDGSKTVTTAGTRVQLVASATPCQYVIITAKSGNAGTIYIGGSTIATGRGKPLVNLQETIINVNDASKIWMDSDNNGDGCTYVIGN